MNIKEVIQGLMNSPKVATGVAGWTAGTGAGTILDWIPDDIGKLATLIGIILSVILIRVHLVNLKKVQLELKIMKEEAAIQTKELE